MYLEDLGTNAYLNTDDRFRAVGWLEAGHPYTKGAVPPDDLAAIKAHLQRAFQPARYLGFHLCSLCPPGTPRAGTLNLVVVTPTLLYIAPELIVHYIEDHGYRPPDEFLAAVRACPPQGSRQFLEWLRPFRYALHNRTVGDGR